MKIKKILNGERLNESDYLSLYTNTSLLELGYIANLLRKKKHPDNSPITFVIDRNINYTNICVCKCKFCAFHKDPGDSEGYVLEYDAIKQKVSELIKYNGTQLLLQGGLNPDINFSYYINLLTNLRKDFPDLTIHAFSPPEIDFISKNNNISIEQLLTILQKAGLNSIPGGGAEILSDDIRYQLSPNKISSDRWLNIMEVAHKLNIKSTATMMAGSIETSENIISHLLKIRDLQDKTSGFTAFISWSFQYFKSDIIPKKIFTGQDYLRLVAISRIILDNIDNIQVSWPTQGIKVAQLGLNFGANDFGGTMLEENVISSTGLKINFSINEIIKAIQALNRRPAQRKTNYDLVVN